MNQNIFFYIHSYYIFIYTKNISCQEFQFGIPSILPEENIEICNMYIESYEVNGMFIKKAIHMVDNVFSKE